MQQAKNVLGTLLQECSCNPKTGYFRDGFCNTDHSDMGRHLVCVVATEDFLQFSKSKGNDLTTPYLEYDFPGLKVGDRWCLCALRWVEAFNEGLAPLVVLEATHENALEYINIDWLKAHQISL